MAAPVITPNPYVGPRAYQTGERIYGREREAGQLINLIIAERIVLLHSPSGAGKTSLIQAAVIPRLMKSRFDVLPTLRVNMGSTGEWSHPAGSNRYLLSAVASLEEGVAPEARLEPQRLATMTLSEYFAERYGTNGGSGRQVLIFDQFEEILTLNPADRADKKAFFEQVGELLDAPNRWALFSMREDYVAALDPFKIAVPSRFTNTFRLDLLGQQAARQAIQRPAQEAGVDFEDAAAEKLVDDLRRMRIQMPDGSVEVQLGPDVEPVQLQVVCRGLWERPRPDRGRITRNDLAAYGEVDQSLVDQSLAQYYAERVAGIAASTGASDRAIREWFDRRLITEQKLRGTVLMGKERSGDLDNRVIRLLIDAFLVRGEKRGGATWFELTHDRLVTPVLRDNAAWFKAHLTLLQQRADVWDQQDRPESLLLQGSELTEAQQWAAAHATDLLPAETDYLAASTEREARARRIRRLNQAISILAVVAVLLSIAALLAFAQANVERNKALRQGRIARAGQLAAESQAALPELPARSLLLAIEALNMTPGAGEARLAVAENALRAALADPRGVPLSGHQRAVTGLAFSPDGQWLVTGSEDRTVRMWPLATGGEAIELRGPATPVTSVAFSADQYWLAAGSTDKAVLVWDLRNGRPAVEPLVLSYGESDSYRLAFGPDGRWLATGSLNGKVLLWDTSRFDTAAEPVVLPSEQATVLALAFSPDGRWLAAGSSDRTANVWDLSVSNLAAAAPRVLRGHTGVVESVAFSPDGRRLATGSRDKTARLWDLADGSGARSGLLEGHGGTVVALAFSPNSRWLATSSNDRTARLWEVDASGDATLRHVLIGHEAIVDALAFSPDSRWLATGSGDGTARLWDVDAADPASSALVLRGHEAPVTSLAISPDGHSLATGSKDGTARLWVVGAGDPTGDPAVLRDHQDIINTLTFNPDGRWLATAGGDSARDQTDTAIRLWRPNAESAGQPPLVLKGHEKWIDVVAFSPDGHWLASAGGDRSARLWDLSASKAISASQELRGHRAWIDTLAFTPDSKWLATGSQDTTVRLWDLRSGLAAATSRMFKAQEGRVSAVAISPDGHWLAAANEYAVLLWDLTRPVQDGAVADRILRGHSDFVTSLAFSPDGHWLATGSDDRSVRLWDMAARDPAGQSVKLAEHEDQVKVVAFSPNGEWLASGGDDKVVRLWHNNGGRPGSSSTVLADHLEPVTALAFSPDSHRLATGSKDAKVRLWDLSSTGPATEPVVLHGHSAPVTAIAFSPDGRTLASAGLDHDVRLWSSSVDQLIQLACRDAGRNLTEQEWRRFFPGEELRKTCSQWP